MGFLSKEKTEVRFCLETRGSVTVGAVIDAPTGVRPPGVEREWPFVFWTRPFCHMISGRMNMRFMVLAVFLFGLAGTGVELLFLNHTNGLAQLVPLVLLVMSLLVLAWHGLERKSASVRAFQITMLLLVAAGVLGTVLHYRANEEFELEGNPDAKGIALLSKALTGAAPALAPGAMIQLGLLGLVYTFRHPALEQEPKEQL